MVSPVIETKQGKISGKIISLRSELTDKKCINFNGIPFATCERLEKPKPHGPWEGTLDGTGKRFFELEFFIRSTNSDMHSTRVLSTFHGIPLKLCKN